jgi:dihydrofolate reductase
MSTTLNNNRRGFSMIVAMDQENGMAKVGDKKSLPWQGTPEGKEDMLWFKQNTCPNVGMNKVALIMGRKTRDEIPKKFFPLPGRINVVVSSSFSEITTVIGALTNEPLVCVNSFAQLFEKQQLLQHPEAKTQLLTKQLLTKAEAKLEESKQQLLTKAEAKLEESKQQLLTKVESKLLQHPEAKTEEMDQGVLTQLLSKVVLSKAIVIGGLEIYKQALEHPDLETVIVTKFHKFYGCNLFFPLAEVEKKFKNVEIVKTTEHATYSIYSK